MRAETGRLEHSTDVHEHLRIDVFVPGRIEDVDFVAKRDLESAVVSLLSLGNCVEKGHDINPTDVVTEGMPENMFDGVAMMAIEAVTIGDHVSTVSLRPESRHP